MDRKARGELSKVLDAPTYHDVICLVFALSGRSFTRDKDETFEFFHKWRDRMPFGREIFFSERPPMAPYSEQVSNAITLLLMGKCIYFWAPYGDRYFWYKGTKRKVVLKLSKRFSIDDLAVIKEMAKEFWYTTGKEVSRCA